MRGSGSQTAPEPPPSMTNVTSAWLNRILNLGGWGKHETCEASSIDDVCCRNAGQRAVVGSGSQGYRGRSRGQSDQPAPAGDQDRRANLFAAYLHAADLPVHFRGSVRRDVLLDPQAP